MAKGTAKLRLLIDLKQKLKGGLDIAKDKVEKATGQMQKRLSDFKLKNVEAFKAIRNEVPGVERVLNMLQNPYILATAAVVTFLALSGKASKEAMSFEHSFMNIRQLNLDKSREELNRYRKDIADTAFITGINLQKMTTGFYDIQSGLSIYGKEVQDISKVIGKYSISTQADYNDSVNQTIKAMKAFKIESKDVKSLLEANAKTVQTGIVTYAELAQVQTEYAGAAAAANQSVDTANKIFAAFTSVAKDANIASTMTKTAFQGFVDPRVLKGLQKWGVEVYDATGNMKPFINILGSATDKISTMSDMNFNQFMGDVGGPEGLRSLFGKLRTGADDFFKTLHLYDNSPVDLDKMYQNALQDPATIASMVRENFKTMFTEFGQLFLPVILKISNGILNMMSWLRDSKDTFDLLKHVITGIGIAWSILNIKMIASSALFGIVAAKTALVTAAQWAWNVALNANPIGLIVIAVGALVGALVYAYKKFDKVKAIIFGTWEVFKLFGNYIKGHILTIIDKLKTKLTPIIEKVKSIGTAIKEYIIDKVEKVISTIQRVTSVVKSLFKKGTEDVREKVKNRIESAKESVSPYTTKIKTVFQNKYQTVMDDAAKQKAAEGETSNDNSTNSIDDPLNPSPVVTDINSIAQGSQSKNITITIDSFIKNFSPEHESVNSMSTDEIERWLSEMFMRVIKSAEQTV